MGHMAAPWLLLDPMETHRPGQGKGLCLYSFQGRGRPRGGQKIGPPPASSPPLPEGMNEPGFFHELGPFEPKAGDSLAPPRFR